MRNSLYGQITINKKMMQSIKFLEARMQMYSYKTTQRSQQLSLWLDLETKNKNNLGSFQGEIGELDLPVCMTKCPFDTIVKIHKNEGNHFSILLEPICKKQNQMFACCLIRNASVNTSSLDGTFSDQAR